MEIIYNVFGIDKLISSGSVQYFAGSFDNMDKAIDYANKIVKNKQAYKAFVSDRSDGLNRIYEC